MGCITSTVSKSPPELCIPQQIQINIIAASKTPSFASSVGGDKSQTANNCASQSVVDGLTSVAMARSVSCTAQLEEETEEDNKSESSEKESGDKNCE